jgi:D-alanine-D-alanine ligase
MARPYVLKPVNEGSSVGVAIVTEGAITAIRSAATSRGRGMHFERLLAEPFIKGRELTVAVLGDEALA